MGWRRPFQTYIDSIGCQDVITIVKVVFTNGAKYPSVSRRVSDRQTNNLAPVQPFFFSFHRHSFVTFHEIRQDVTG